MNNNVYVYVGKPETIGSAHVKIVYNTVFGTVSSEANFQDIGERLPEEVAVYLSSIFSAGMAFCAWRDSYVLCASDEIADAVSDMFELEYDGINVLPGSIEEYDQLRSGAHLRKNLH